MKKDTTKAPSKKNQVYIFFRITGAIHRVTYVYPIRIYIRTYITANRMEQDAGTHYRVAGRRTSGRSGEGRAPPQDGR